MTGKPFAFVLMPFDEAFSDIYRLGIQETCSKREVVAERVDDQIYTETILERIYRQIDAADFVIADMTGRNANVFYEVGYAHAKKKLCILLTQDAADIPFDLKHHRHIVYPSVVALRASLGAEIDWCLTKLATERTVPVAAELKIRSEYFDRKDWKDTAKLDLYIDLHNPTERVSPDIDALYLHTSGGWDFEQEGKACATQALPGTPKTVRHFVRSPVNRLAPGGWAQVILEGKKTLWTKWSGGERQEKYKLAGRLRLEVSTASATYTVDEALALELDEIPF